MQAKQAIAKLPDDPRTTVFLISMLSKANWPGSSAKEIWETVCDKLIALQDRRAIEPLRAMAATPPYFQGAAFTKWCVEQIAATADRLAKQKARPDDAATNKLADAQLATPPKLGWFATRSTAGADALLAKVWAAPDDLPLRSVIGDALQELEDPWGELIALQMAAKSDSPRIKELLKTHGARFTGPLVHVSSRSSMTFEHGFLASCTVDRQMVGRRHWEDVVVAPHWATVRHVAFGPWGKTPRWWFKDWLHKSNLASLREIQIVNVTLTRVSASGPWKLEKTPQRTEWAVEDTVDALLKGMPLAELSRIPAPSITKYKQLIADAIEAAS
ncbi:MAG: hypothetical protein H0V17_23000 [Deltaproteobacteria bacterium]|nr:hypothetical protein [Deltaproteobacteria bacterium]